MASRVAPPFNPETAAQAYFDQHAAECAELDLNCAGGDASLEIALNLIAMPLAVLFVALVLHRLRFWSGTFALFERAFRRKVFASAAFGGFVMAMFVIARAPFEFYRRVVLEISSGPKLVFVGDDPRFAPPSFFEKSTAFLWDQAEFALYLGLIAAIIAPLVIWALGRAPKVLVMLAGLAYFAWAVTPQTDSWRDTYDIPAGELRADVAEIAERAEIGMDRVKLGYKSNLAFGQEEARAEWHDGGTKAIMNEAMLNILRFEPRIWSPPFQSSTAPEFRAVTAHELAHLVHYHWQWLIFASALAVALFTGLAGIIADRLAFAGGKDSAPNAQARAAFIALFLALAFALTHIWQPLRANIIRVSEHQADATALELGRDPGGAAAVALRFARGRPLERRRWYHHLYITHPDPRARIERAMEWKAQNEPANYRAIGPAGPIRMRYVDNIDLLEDDYVDVYEEWPPIEN